MKKIDFIEAIAEGANWQVSYDTQNEGKEIAFEFETWTTTANQNVVVSVVVDFTDDKDELLESLSKELYDYYESFDPEEEAGLWWNNRDKVRGVPVSLRTLLDDMDEAESLIEKLYKAFERAC